MNEFIFTLFVPFTFQLWVSKECIFISWILVWCKKTCTIYSKFAIIILIIKISLNSHTELQIQQNKSNGLSDFAITKCYCTDQNHANKIYVPVYKICYTMLQYSIDKNKNILKINKWNEYVWVICFWFYFLIKINFLTNNKVSIQENRVKNIICGRNVLGDRSTPE